MDSTPEFFNVSPVQAALDRLGITEDPQKEPRPSNGGYWDSGVVASLSTDGEIRWVKKVAVSGYSDYFRGITVVSDAIYAVGNAAAFVQSGRRFGYGWIAKISHDSGDMLAHLTIGATGYQSWFGGALTGGDVIYCGGGKYADYVDDGYRSWFCEVDIVDPPPMIRVVRPGPAGSPAPNIFKPPKYYSNIGRIIERNDL